MTIESITGGDDVTGGVDYSLVPTKGLTPAQQVVQANNDKRRAELEEKLSQGEQDVEKTQTQLGEATESLGKSEMQTAELQKWATENYPKGDIHPPEYQPLTPKDIQGALFPMLIMTTIGGLGSRRHYIGALKAFGAMLQGAGEGRKEAFDVAKTNYEAQMQNLTQRQNSFMREFQGILANNKLDLTAKQNAIRNLEMQYGKQVQHNDSLERAIDRTFAEDQNFQNMLQKHNDVVLRLIGTSASGSADLARAHGRMLRDGMPITQVVPGYGSNPTVIRQRAEAQEEALRQIQAEHPGMSAEDAGGELALAQIGYGAEKGSVANLVKMRGTVKMALDQLEFNVGKVNEQLDRLPGSNLSPIINAIYRGEQKWTGDPRYYDLFFYMNAAAMESARIISGGTASIQQLHEGARKEAEQWANANMTPDSWRKGVAPAMIAEGKNRMDNFESALQYQTKHGATGEGTVPPPQKGPAPQGTVTPKLLKDYAAQHKISEQQAREFLQSKGYTVQ